MAYAVEQLKTVGETIRAGQELFGLTSPDKVAWLTLSALGVVLKAHKYDRGNIYRQVVQSVSPVYRAAKAEKGVSGLAAYELWYKMGPEALRRIKRALAAATASTTTA